MKYPTLAQVESASQEQLCRWHRFLHSPGAEAIWEDNFKEVLNREMNVLNRIEERFVRGGCFTPELSKKIGWDV